jgi:transcriptional regulator with XRE-family HTH domain
LDAAHVDRTPSGVRCLFCGTPGPDPEARSRPSLVLATSFGERLQHAREERGLSVEDAARQTCISPRYLQALEEESTGGYPGPVYQRFFLREYADFLGLDRAPLLAAFDRTADPAPPTQLPVSAVRQRRVPAVALRVLAIAALAGVVGFAFWHRLQTQDGAPPRLGPKPTFVHHTESVASRPPATGHATSIRGVRAVLHFKQDSWVNAVADGRTVVRRTLRAGRTAHVAARHALRLTLGNAGGVALRVNGRAVRTGSGASVVHLRLRISHGHMRVRRR